MIPSENRELFLQGTPTYQIPHIYLIYMIIIGGYKCLIVPRFSTTLPIPISP